MIEYIFLHPFNSDKEYAEINMMKKNIVSKD